MEWIHTYHRPRCCRRRPPRPHSRQPPAAGGWSATAFAFRRLGVLAVFGLIHALVFWYGEILFLYALMGGWLLLARGASWRALFVTTCLLLVGFSHCWLARFKAGPLEILWRRLAYGRGRS